MDLSSLRSMAGAQNRGGDAGDRSQRADAKQTAIAWKEEHI
jgi:hypothetical protein